MTMRLSDEENGAAASGYSRKSEGSFGIEQVYPPDRRIIDPAEKELGEVNLRVRRLLRADLVSNILLSIGGIAFIWSSARAIMGGGRGMVADVVYFSGLATFSASGLIQVVIDALWTRSIAFGRYSTHKYSNLAITFLFLSGVIADGVAFIFWRKGGAEAIGKERISQWVASILWLLASVFVVATNLRRNRTAQDKLDVFGNLFFLFEAVMNLCARFVSDTLPEEGNTVDETEQILELVAAVCWTCSALFYLAGGSIRIRKLRRHCLT